MIEIPGVKIAFVASSRDISQQALTSVKELYHCVEPMQADVIVVLGGDGFMLETMHRFMGQGIKFYGMNRGTVGFLMNDFDTFGLDHRLKTAKNIILHPLKMTATTVFDQEFKYHAINEVSLLRQSYQAAKISIKVDGIERIKEVTCDGVMVATPAGSTAYNFSVNGPIIPIGSELLALTPISTYRPRRWRGALLSHCASVEFDIQDSEKRPVSVFADHQEVKEIAHVKIEEDRSIDLNLLFDPQEGLEERILREQFFDV